MRTEPINPSNLDFVETLYSDPEIRLQLFAPSMNPGEFQRWVYGTNDRYVIFDGDAPVGVAVLSRKGSRAFWGYALAPEFRGKGLASKCIGVIESLAKSLGIMVLTTNVAGDNEASVRALPRLVADGMDLALPAHGKAGHRQFEWVEMNI